jgi:hypothetical protein
MNSQHLSNCNSDMSVTVTYQRDATNVRRARRRLAARPTQGQTVSKSASFSNQGAHVCTCSVFLYLTYQQPCAADVRQRP